MITISWATRGIHWPVQRESILKRGGNLEKTGRSRD
jgi:hypothetical protein